MPVIDSSTLISFAKIGKLDYLKRVKNITCPQEVYTEIVEVGLCLGYADAVKLKKVFEERGITIRNAVQSKKCSGISDVDSKVISLALDEKELWVDDVKLSRKAKSENIQVKNTVEILSEMKVKNKITKKE